jgi:hypothetical protein
MDELLNRARERLVQLAKCGAAAVLYAGGQACPGQAPALRPSSLVQAREQDLAQAEDLSRPVIHDQARRTADDQKLRQAFALVNPLWRDQPFLCPCRRRSD